MTTLALTREQSRQVDRLAIEIYGFSGLVLMENAGRGVADRLERLGIDGAVVICCGRGNNGGDGFVIARHLDLRGYSIRVLLYCDPSQLAGDALANYRILEKTDVPIHPSYGNPAGGDLQKQGAGAAWIVDA
ncbi:MAG: NAD(P)H-hydrate epimerase, partial [Thermoguttaceae bacterium]